jgi:hypothetical protein
MGLHHIYLITTYPYYVSPVFWLVCSFSLSLQLLFTCYLCPTGGRPPKNASYRCRPDHLCYHLVFFSTFEELKLPISWPMEHTRVSKLYEPLPTPCLYVAPAAANMVGRVLLIPLFLAGNSTPTIPHQYSQHKWSGFPVGRWPSASHTTCHA